jgi:hypothetical protein
MNEQTWAALQGLGLTAESEVRLDFFYEAPSRGAADELAAFLRQETDYDVSATDESVAGRTQPTTVDLAKLNQWVEWMLAAGAEKGRCKFDGWGTQV